MLTEQEMFWQGEFGNEYIERNKGEKILAGNIALFAEVFKKIEKIKSILEFGAGIGNNLQAIKILLPEVIAIGVEINEKATLHMEKFVNIVSKASIFDPCEFVADFVLSKGLLIHLAPEKLKEAYQIIYNASNKYICFVEYYNPTPLAISYREHGNKLFKRDFAGEMLDLYSDLCLIDYGFVYHRDKFKQDDVHWWIMEKKVRR